MKAPTTSAIVALKPGGGDYAAHGLYSGPAYGPKVRCRLSILLRKRRQLVAALLGRDMGRVETFSRVKPTSAVLLDNALTAVEEWCGGVQSTLRECFEDQRIADDLTHDLAETLADLRTPRPRQPHPSLAYKSLFARVARVKAGVEKLSRELDLYTEPKHLAPLTPEESALVTSEQMRAPQKAVFAVTKPREAPVQPAPARTREAPAGSEWGELAALHAAIDELGSGPYRVQTGRGEYEVRDIFEAVQVLRKDGAVS